jgi:NADH-quinone oxidoreductase subunit D
VALGKLPAHLVPMEAIDQALERTELNLGSDPMLLQMGPAHPAMHGTVRIVMELRGETIERCDVQVGYLHRGFEKMCERGSWTQVFPYVDRANHCSPMLNNVGFALACEKLLGVQVPERCQWREAYGYTEAATESLASTS